MGEAGTGILAQNKEKGDIVVCQEKVAMQYSSGTHWNGLMTGVGVCVSGLSEVIGGMGQEKLHKLMGDIISTAERPDIMPNVRDGYIMTYIYLPSVFGTDFAQYVGPILPSILQVRHKLSLFCCFFH